jgi:hypothetical protein
MSGEDQAADLIERFLTGRVGRYEWDDFISIRQKDPKLAAITLQIMEIERRFRRQKATEWCTPDGLTALAELARTLRCKAQTTNLGDDDRT